MRTATDLGWDAFVVSAWPGLVRTATLLSADPGAAGALAEAALVRTRRSRAPDGDPDRFTVWQERARRALLTLRAVPGARLRRRIRGSRSDPRREPDPVLGRYRALGGRQRALLVLMVAEGLDVDAAGAVLGLPAGTAAHEVAAAIDALRVASSDGLVELDLGDLPRDDGPVDVDALLARDAAIRDLRDGFARLAAAAPVTDDDAPRRVGLALVADRRSRRRRAVLASCLSLVAVTGTAGVGRENARAEAARLQLARERAAYAAQHPSVLDGDVSTWPTRGSLASDPQLLASVRARVSGRPSVVFAGDVLGVDVVVAITEAGGATLLHILAGRPGTPLDTWRESGDQLVDGPGAVPAVSAAVRDDQGRLHVLTVTLTAGVVVSYSPAPVLANDASVSRHYLRLPLTDGIGAALVTGTPDRLRMRVDSAGSEAIVHPLVVPPPLLAADIVPALRVPVTRPASCRRFREVADVPRLVQEAVGDAGLSASDVTAVRLLWCRRDGTQGEEALALSARRGPDIQCYALGGQDSDGIDETSWQCWPVPRGTGTTTPFLAPALAGSDAQARDLPVTVHAPGAALAEFQAKPAGSPTVARARVAPDGYGRFVVSGTRTEPRELLLEREGAITLLDSRGHPVSVLLVSAQHPSDVWGEAADGPVVEP